VRVTTRGSFRWFISLVLPLVRPGQPLTDPADRALTRDEIALAMGE
jgi:hypothetical protein